MSIKRFYPTPEPYQHDIPTGFVVEVTEQDKIRVGVQSPSFSASTELTLDNAKWAIKLLESAVQIIEERNRIAAQVEKAFPPMDGPACWMENEESKG